MVFRWPVAGTPHAGNMQIARLKRAHTMTEAPTRGGWKRVVGGKGEEGVNLPRIARERDEERIECT